MNSALKDKMGENEEKANAPTEVGLEMTGPWIFSQLRHNMCLAC